MRSFLCLKYLAISFCIGIATMLCLSALMNLMGGEVAALAVMGPGAILSELSGYGGHDLPGFLIFIIGNALYYWALAFFAVVGWLSRRPNDEKRETSNPSA